MTLRTHSVYFARAFYKNCPSVRLTRAEKSELERLFAECIEEGKRRVLARSISHDTLSFYGRQLDT